MTFLRALTLAERARRITERTCEASFDRAVAERELAAYRAQDWAGARQALAAAREAAPELLGKFYDMYETRIGEYSTNPPPADWDGVYVAMTKGG